MWRRRRKKRKESWLVVSTPSSLRLEIMMNMATIRKGITIIITLGLKTIIGKKKCPIGWMKRLILISIFTTNKTYSHSHKLSNHRLSNLKDSNRSSNRKDIKMVVRRAIRRGTTILRIIRRTSSMEVKGEVTKIVTSRLIEIKRTKLKTIQKLILTIIANRLIVRIIIRISMLTTIVRLMLVTIMNS